MGYKDKCVFIFTEEPGQPEYMGMVQIVGRLVQDQYGWIFKQEFDKQDLGPPATSSILESS